MFPDGILIFVGWMWSRGINTEHFLNDHKPNPTRIHPEFPLPIPRATTDSYHTPAPLPWPTGDRTFKTFLEMLVHRTSRDHQDTTNCQYTFKQIEYLLYLKSYMETPEQSCPFLLLFLYQVSF